MTLLEQLKELKTNGPKYLEFGICSNVDDDPCELFELFEKWPEFSGSIDYPVPHPTLNPIDAYNGFADLWIGEYGEARKRLLDFCITELEKSE